MVVHYKHDGTIDNAKSNPTQHTPQPVESITRKEARLAIVQGLMTGVTPNISSAAARARMRDFKRQVEALDETTGTDNEKAAKLRAKGALEIWQQDETFSKQELTVILNDMQEGTDLANDEKNAILALYPEA
jgi:hypothetical protein